MFHTEDRYASSEEQMVVAKNLMIMRLCFNLQFLDNGLFRDIRMYIRTDDVTEDSMRCIARGVTSKNGLSHDLFQVNAQH